MKLSLPNIVLLASCFGIAFEFRKMINNVGPLSGPLTQHGEPMIKRKDWLKSDRRKQMEEVAIRQGWVQYVDAATKKRFWFCPHTNESFFELVFVGTESVRLNRWCSPGDSGGAQIRKNINHGYVPPPSSSGGESVPRTLSSREQEAEELNEVNQAVGISESDKEDGEELMGESFSNYNEVNENNMNGLMSKPKRVKGRHTKGRKAVKKTPPRLMKKAEEMKKKMQPFDKTEHDELPSMSNFIEKTIQEEDEDGKEYEEDDDEKEEEYEEGKEYEEDDEEEDMAKGTSEIRRRLVGRRRGRPRSPPNFAIPPDMANPPAFGTLGSGGELGSVPPEVIRRAKRSRVASFDGMDSAVGGQGGSMGLQSNNLNVNPSSAAPVFDPIQPGLPQQRRAPRRPRTGYMASKMQSEESAPPGRGRGGRRQGNPRNGYMPSYDPAAVDPQDLTPPSTSSTALSNHRYPFFMHLHKSAGTTLCELAGSNKMRAAGLAGDHALGFNCNILGDDPGHLGLGVPRQDSTYGQADGKFSCEERYSMLQKRGLQFSAIERWIYPQEICPEKFIYMTCFRDPISRIKSSVKFHKRQTEQIVLQWAKQNVYNPKAPISTGSASVDNFYVRSLAGKDVFLKKLGQITQDDMLIAQHILSQFEIVLILESFTRDLLQLKVKLGWNINSMGRAKSSAGKKCEFSKEETEYLKKLNSLDYELYGYAQKRAQELSKEAAGSIVTRMKPKVSEILKSASTPEPPPSPPSEEA